MTSQQRIYDLVVIGGGINGAGIAADAAGRGLSVLLCEMGDLASATSSSSSKLIHGGLRYLEYYEFRLVKEALSEREVLLYKAPHIIRPLRFRLPHHPHLRPAWVIRLGLFLYDHLAKRITLPSSNSVLFNKKTSPLKPAIVKGFEYSDGWVDDSRLVVLNAIAAQQKGATILTRTQCIDAHRTKKHWSITLQNTLNHHTQEVQARTLVNATGPWVSSLFNQVIQTTAPQKIRMIKGSHIIVPRLHKDPHAYILQNEDARIVFVIPYEQTFSLIGTTDHEYFGDPGQVAIEPSEISYLLNIVNAHFKQQINERDIVHSYSGVRPLLDNASNSAQAITRDYTFELDAPNNDAPLLSIIGGKITTYRKLAEAAVNQLCQYFPQAGPQWTAREKLPGGDFNSLLSLQTKLQQCYPWLSEPLIQRYLRSYGTLTHQLLRNCCNESALGQHFGAGLYQAEVEYLVNYEWALTAEDILWRRSKLGLSSCDIQVNELQTCIDALTTQNHSLHSARNESRPTLIVNN